jgi:hypothetical protein
VSWLPRESISLAPRKGGYRTFRLAALSKTDLAQILALACSSSVFSSSVNLTEKTWLRRSADGLGFRPAPGLLPPCLPVFAMRQLFDKSFRESSPNPLTAPLIMVYVIQEGKTNPGRDCNPIRGPTETGFRQIPA